MPRLKLLSCPSSADDLAAARASLVSASWQDDLFTNLDAECVGNRLEPLDANLCVAGRLVALNLLFLQPQALGQRGLTQAGCGACANERVGQLPERVELQDGYLPATQRFVVGQIGAQLLDLAVVLVTERLPGARMEVASVLLDTRARLLKTLQPLLMRYCRSFVIMVDPGDRSRGCPSPGRTVGS
jgi:hypothetical protein